MAKRRSSNAWRAKAPGLPVALARAFPSFIDPEDKIARRRGADGERGAVRERDVLGERRDVEGPPSSTSVDWRTSGAVPPPRSQEACNACTSFAIVTAVESLHFIKTHSSVHLAPGFIHTCLANHDCAHGVAPDDALKAVTRSGIAFGFAGDYPFPPAQCGVTTRFPVAGRAQLPGPNAAMHAIEASGPVIGDMFIDPPFLTLGAGAIYRFQDDDNRRLHTVAVIGYDRDRSFWLIANSFGALWGDGGFARIAFGSGGLLSARAGWQILL